MILGTALLAPASCDDDTTPAGGSDARAADGPAGGSGAAGGAGGSGGTGGSAATGGSGTAGTGGSAGTGGTGTGGSTGGTGGGTGGTGGGGTDANPSGDSAGGGACQVDNDCRLFDDYCTGCDCRPLAKGDPDPKCPGPGVACTVQPCARKKAACQQGKCVAVPE